MLPYLACIFNLGKWNLSLPRPRGSWQGWLSIPLPRAHASKSVQVCLPEVRRVCKQKRPGKEIQDGRWWSQRRDFVEPRRLGWRSLHEAVFGTEVSGSTSHRESPLCWWRWRGECSGLLTLRGPKEAWEWEGLESLLLRLLPLSFWPRLLTSSDASLDHFSKEVCNVPWFSPLCYQWHVGGQSTLWEDSLPFSSSLRCLKAQEHHMETKQTEKDEIPRWPESLQSQSSVSNNVR